MVLAGEVEVVGKEIKHFKKGEVNFVPIQVEVLQTVEYSKCSDT